MRCRTLYPGCYRRGWLTILSSDYRICPVPKRTGQVRELLGSEFYQNPTTESEYTMSTYESIVSVTYGANSAAVEPRSGELLKGATIIGTEQAIIVFERKYGRPEHRGVRLVTLTGTVNEDDLQCWHVASDTFQHVQRSGKTENDIVAEQSERRAAEKAAAADPQPVTPAQHDDRARADQHERIAARRREAAMEKRLRETAEAMVLAQHQHEVDAELARLRLIMGVTQPEIIEGCNSPIG